MRRPIECDVFVAGGGPAGLAVAIAARRAGFDVLVADAAHPPIDKACGEGIMPDGIDALSGLGITIPAHLSVPFRGICFVDDAGRVAAEFPAGEGRGLRRTALHEILLHAATALDVRTMWDARVSDGLMVDGASVRARWVVAADGCDSRLAVAAGLHDARPGTRRIGFREHYRLAPWSDLVEVHWADCGQLYITPTAADDVCVAFVTRHAGLRLPDAISAFPEAARRLSGARSIEPVRGAITATRKLRAVHRGNLALAGDASGSVDAVTGEGLSMAFRQANALAAAMRAGDLAPYERAHREILRRPLAMARLMLLMDRHPHFRHRVFRILSSAPDLFATLLEIHIGAKSPLQLGLRNAAAFGWRLITA